MVNILTQMVVTAVAWLILMLACTNLIGLLVRGFFTSPEMENLIAGDDDVSKLLRQDYQSNNRVANIIALTLIIIFLSALYYFWNIGLVIAALMLMAARIPDLIWEIRHGRNVDHFEMILQPRSYRLISMINYASVPVIWYALYRM